MEPLTQLRNYMKNVQPGRINPDDAVKVEKLLCEAWGSLKITTDDAKLQAYKLLGRTETLAWNPPVLTFDTERHGPTVRGSIKAQVHPWTIDLSAGTAAKGWPAVRQVGVKDKAFKAQPIAEEIAALILSRKEDPRLEWKDENNVRVLIGEVIPARKQQTTSGRRERFRLALENSILPQGWMRKSANSYEHSASVPATNE